MASKNPPTPAGAYPHRADPGQRPGPSAGARPARCWTRPSRAGTRG